jgi:hypothetical protein
LNVAFVVERWPNDIFNIKMQDWHLVGLPAGLEACTVLHAPVSPSASTKSFPLRAICTDAAVISAAEH